MRACDRVSAEDDQTFTGLDLGGAVLSGKDFCCCVFRNLKAQESRWKRTRLEDCTFESCDLTKADLAAARSALVNRAKNRVKGARISIETAILLAASAGMQVDGVSPTK